MALMNSTVPMRMGKSTDYHSPSDVSTLIEAHKIRSDPSRHAAAKAHAKTQLDAMRAIGQPLDQPTKMGKEKGKPDAEDRKEAKGKK